MKKVLACAALAACSLALPVPASAAEAGPLVSVTECPPDSVGVIVWHADYNTGSKELVRVCIPIGS